MASAYIIFDNTQRRLTPDHLLAYLRDECGVAASLGEWRFFDRVVTRVHVATTPAIALQINENPICVPEGISELLLDAGEALGEQSRAAAGLCRSRVEVVSTEPTEIMPLSAGGIMTHTPEAELGTPAVQSVLRHLTEFLNGWCYDNVNGQWIGLA